MKISSEIRAVSAASILGFVFLFPKLLFFHQIARPWTPQRVLQAVEEYSKWVFPSTDRSPRRPAPYYPRPSGKTRQPFPWSPPGAGGSSQPVLQGIISEPHQRFQAVINNQILNPGDTVQGYLLQEIRQKEVLLEKEGKTYRLSADSGLKAVTENAPSENETAEGGP